MRRGLTLVGVLGLCVGLSGVGGSDVPPKTDDKLPMKPGDAKIPTRKELMAAKLKHTQAILEGLTLNDMGKVSTASDELILVTRANDFLNAYKGDEYQYHLKTFRKASLAVGKKARDKNVDGVMVAYNDLTLSCLKCHQAMRDKEFDAALPKVGDRKGE
jgi:hypothetical protein